MTGENWDGMVVLCAANNWDDVKVADRHLAECLTAHAPVLYVDPPMSHLTAVNHPDLAGALDKPRLRVVAPRLARLTPVVPPRGQRRGVVGVTNYMVRRHLRRAVHQLGGRTHAVVSTWLLLDVFGACGERERVYWWQDDPAGAADLWHMDERRLCAGERRLATTADVVIVSNAMAVDRWADVEPKLVPFGCDAVRMATVDDVAPARGIDLPGPIAGFVGRLNSRTDLTLLEEIAQRGISLLLVGPVDPSFEPTRVGRLLGAPNVASVGPQAFEALPSFLRVIDVGLVPYAPSPFNIWSYPLKTLEYLAAGRPVVATSLPATRSLGTDVVTFADEPIPFADATQRWLETPREQAAVDRRRSVATRHSWSNRAVDFAEAIGLDAA